MNQRAKKSAAAVKDAPQVSLPPETPDVTAGLSGAAAGTPATPAAPAAPSAPAVTLDDLQGQSPGAPAEAAPEVQPDPEPMTEEQILGLIGFVTSMGLPADAVQVYQAELMNNPLLRMFLPMLELPQVLAKYGIGGGAGGPMPEWLRGVLGAGLIGYVVVTTRSQYATRPERQKDAVPDVDPDGFGNGVPAGFSTNIPAGVTAQHGAV